MPPKNGLHETLFHRHSSNPILSCEDWPYPCNTVFNAGATLLEDGTTLLLCRVEDRRGHSHLCVARSTNGIDGWVFGPQEVYEREGDVGNVVFPCGYTIGDDGDTIHLYYGGADTCIALATGSVRDLLAWLQRNGVPDGDDS